ncbi:conserved protein, unknown function [Hepatocystis sp. ex Piliocolobus tephrosceles]|nr:conserved protein, unknown function [Hepatocystis sp. ex Piliocolobus tephrosceles]
MSKIGENTEQSTAIKTKKRRTVDDENDYYSIKFPKFIDVCPGIKKNENKDSINVENKKKNEEKIKDKKNNILLKKQKTENETINEITNINKKKASLITWSYDENMYNKMKIYNLENEKKNVTNNDDNDDNDNKDDNDNNDNNVLKNSNKKNIGEIKNVKVNELDNLVSDDSDSDDSLESLYNKYEIKNKNKIMNNVINTEHNNLTMNTLCNNLKFLNTNSFLVEYEDGSFCLIVNENKHSLEKENETNYLIEYSNDIILPIQCKINHKFYIKSILKEEQTKIPENIIDKENIFYMLNDTNVDKNNKKGGL